MPREIKTGKGNKIPRVKYLKPYKKTIIKLNPLVKTLPKLGRRDLMLAAMMEKVIKGVNKKRGTETCDKLDGSCFDCKTRIMVAYLNEWIDFLTN